MDALSRRADIDGRDSLDGYKTSNGVIHSFVCSLTCRHDRRMLCKLHRIVYNMPSGMRPFFRGDALRVTDKHSRRVVGGQAQPHGWTQA